MRWIRLLSVAASALALFTYSTRSQGPEKPLYLDPTQPVEKRIGRRCAHGVSFASARKKRSGVGS